MNMRRMVSFLWMAALTAGLIYLLDRPLGSSPALGKLLDPFRGIWASTGVDAWREGERTIHMDLLDAAVQVRYDEHHIPHIFASSIPDAIRAQGYITAMDRLWQMEFQTHAAAGRLSEVLGPDLEEKGDGKLLRYDRLQRRLGMVYAAEEALAAAQEDDSAMLFLTAYSEGVNAYIRELNPAELPEEYKLLGYRPEAWSPLKSMLLMKSMGQDLSSTEYDLPYTNLLRQLGKADFEALFPDEGGNTSPIVPPGTPYAFPPLDIDTPESYEPPVLAAGIREPQRTIDGVGSNNWAVSGTRTQSGVPILCNDPHLQLNLPAIWYQIQLDAPGLHVCGASLPGAPGVIIGFNRDIAWGVTNAGRDVRDWYKIRFQDATREAYWFEGVWRPTTSRVETLRIKGQPDQYDTVRYTHHGPVVYDRSFEHAELEGYAMRWELHQRSMEMRTFMELNMARNYADYRKAIAYFQCPGQNLLLATRDGDIAITQQGRFPARWPGQGRFLLDGSRADHDWQGYIPSEQNATSVNPERGFVSSANQYPADSTYPYYQLGSFEEHRNKRINDRLSTMGNAIRVEDLKALQLDNYGLLAEETLPSMLRAYPEAATAFTGWDYQFSAASREAARFQSWYNTLYDLIWDEWDSFEGSTVKPEHYVTARLMQREPDSKWFDRKDTPEKENLADLARDAWTASATDAEWWAFKHTDILHLLKLDPFNVLSVHNGGYRGIVNATSERHGPSWRMVVELSDPPKAWGIYPGGQSGHPASAHYSDFVDDWAGGNYYELLFFQNDADRPERTAYSLELQP